MAENFGFVQNEDGVIKVRAKIHPPIPINDIS